MLVVYLKHKKKIDKVPEIFLEASKAQVKEFRAFMIYALLSGRVTYIVRGGDIM